MAKWLPRYATVAIVCSVERTTPHSHIYIFYATTTTGDRAQSSYLFVFLACLAGRVADSVSFAAGKGVTFASILRFEPDNGASFVDGCFSLAISSDCCFSCRSCDSASFRVWSWTRTDRHWFSCNRNGSLASLPCSFPLSLKPMTWSVPSERAMAD